MPPRAACRRGDVVLVLFPHSDLRTAKTRPAVSVQADDLHTGMPQVIVAMISGRMFRAGHPSRVVIAVASPAGRQSGLLGDSVVMADNVATIGLAAIDRVIGSIPMLEIDLALRRTFAL
ncbi:MAG: type II toxin-antitoxin system PemK/MazF family toxin [Planctomycetia bacterium]|nr:type II toxin-antitoxin system PemK/MazF family toxin [Planctomycetia bacterium]